MPHDDSRYPDDWLTIAEKDLRRVTLALSGGDPELAGFCLQQAAEKFLKAFLLAKGWKLRRTHDLEALLDYALAYDPSLERFRPACQRITKYYTVDRYPIITDACISEKDIQDSLDDIQGLVEKIRETIH